MGAGGVRRRAVVRSASAVVVVLLLLVGYVVVDALQAPTDDPVPAKLAEWGRDHGLGAVITWLEGVTYQQPPVGGVPEGGIPLVAPAPPRAAKSRSAPLTPSLAPLTGGAPLAGEGQWQTVAAVSGRPAVQVAFLRPDDQHTSFLAGILRIDPTLVRGELHPGTLDPGGRWRASTSLTGPVVNGLAAVFNGGFRLTDPSHPGYFSEGRTVTPLVDGAASLVLYTDGHADVGAWNRQVRMGPDVASVRQNLVPLVDAGQINPDCATGGTRQWGSTIGQRAFIHRSAFGVTATGIEVYVGGPALSVCTLGRLLTDAGVVRGMELDINPNWVSGTWFHTGPAGRPAGEKLFPAEQVSPSHYLSASSRDWYSWNLRTPGRTG